LLSADKKAKAIWTTTEERNTASFDVQRSSNGQDFVTLGYVAAANVSGINTYNYTDAQPLKGVSYYRLKQIDKDARVTYSNIIRVSINDGYSVSVYPNPASYSITVTHPQASARSLINVVTIDGRIIKTVKAKGSFTTISVEDISAGIYVVQLTMGSEIIQEKFIRK